MIWILALWIGCVIGFLAMGAAEEFEKIKIRERWKAELKPVTKLPSFLWQWNTLWIFALAPLLEIDFLKTIFQFYARQLALVGLSRQVSAKEWVAFKIVLGVEFGLVGFFFPWGFFFSLVGFFWPDLWLMQTKAARWKKAELELPLVMDLLALSVEAGLDFAPALKRIADFLPKTVLGEELQKSMEEMQLGSTRLEAMQSLAIRLPLKPIKSLVTHLTQSMKLGSPLAPILNAQAARLRQIRFQSAEKAGIYAAQKMLLPLIFCIVPSVFVIIFGPLMVRWYYGGFSDLF